MSVYCNRVECETFDIKRLLIAQYFPQNKVLLTLLLIIYWYVAFNFDLFFVLGLFFFFYAHGVQSYSAGNAARQTSQ